MFDDFFLRAILAGIGVALVAGPLGCFVVWRRLSYFGDTMAHSALLGVALAIAVDIDPLVGVIAVTIAVALALIAFQRTDILPSDALLGILSHAALAIGLVVIALLASTRVDLFGYLFGDILAVSVADLAVIYGGGAALLAVLIAIWRPLLAATVSADIAAAENIAPERYRFVFTMLIAAIIAISLKIVGILLITAMLIIPAATARSFVSNPERMAFGAALFGVFSVAAGLLLSLRADTPSGPSIVVAALLLFLASLILRRALAGAADDGNDAS